MEIKNLDLTRSATHQIASSKATPRETAEQIVEKWWIDPVAPDASLDELKSAIEAALLAERNRCAEIVESFDGWVVQDDSELIDEQDSLINLATAIRSNEG